MTADAEEERGVITTLLSAFTAQRFHQFVPDRKDSGTHDVQDVDSSFYC